MSEVIKKGCDVLVVGGGPSGAIAAVAAARTGARTLLIEKNSFFGGTATAAMVGQFFAFYHTEQKTVAGIADELLERIEAAGGSKGFNRYLMAEAADTPLSLMSYPFDPEILKFVLDDFLTDSRVGVLLCTRATDVIMTDGKLTGVMIHGTSQRGLVTAACTVDASADAVVAEKAGVEFLDVCGEAGRRLQPMTLVFRLAGVDVRKVRSLPRDAKREIIMEGLATGDLYWKSLSFSSTPAGNDAVCLMSRVMDCDPLDDEQISKAYITGRRQVRSIVQFLKRRMPGFENAVLVNVASTMGVRESRQIRGVYTVTDDDVLTSTPFPDAIAIGSGPYDIHDPSGTGITLKMPDRPFAIPYRCMLPERVRGLVVTGRAVSATKGAIATIRHMGTMMAVGHAAGTAAALAILSGKDPAAIDVEELQAALVSQGALISPDMLYPEHHPHPYPPPRKGRG
jgi:hypothetical protein